MRNIWDVNKDQIMIDWVNRYQALLLHMCYVYLRDQELARDAVQETFLKAYRAMDDFRGECSDKTWLIRIALNICKSMRRSAWIRHHDRRVTLDDALQTVVVADEAGTDVMCEIMKLPVKLREMVMLYYWQEMSEAEIARTLGVAQSTVSRRLNQAQKRLRDMMERRDNRGRSQE